MVHAKIRRWCDDNFLGLWSEGLGEGDILTCQMKPKKDTPESTHAANALWVNRAIEHGQYKKAIYALTSSSLVQTPEVCAEMLAKHPQEGLPSVPSFPVPTFEDK